MKVVEVNYYQFMQQLKHAASAGARIEKTDRQRWSSYCRAHGVREAASMVHGKRRSESMQPVIIDGVEGWNGFYLYSTTDEVSLRFEFVAPAAFARQNSEATAPAASEPSPTNEGGEAAESPSPEGSTDESPAPSETPPSESGTQSPDEQKPPGEAGG